jgi:exopolysaccharide production protein ExoQ
MPPTVALLLTVGFISLLFWRDFREKPNLTPAFWIVFTWVLIMASKTVGQWLSVVGLGGFGAASVEEGSSLDAIVFLALIVMGLRVLSKREVSLREFARDNRWLVLFMAYCFVAIFWSDFPFVSFKRWIKVLGHPIMVLLIFTEPDPMESLARLMKRVSYVVFPLSICWMKYFPALGRKASDWGGMMNTGVTGGKNELGAMCYIFGLFVVWYLLQVWRMNKGKARRDQLLLCSGLLFLICYCLRKAHSSTSDISFLLGVALIVLLGLKVVNKRLVTAYVIIGVFGAVVAQLTFDVYGSVIDLTGHEATIEGRGRLWEYLWQNDTSPIFGVGFESYWLGDRVLKIWDMPEFAFHPTEAHNGYLETYINLGAVGFLLLFAVIAAIFKKCRHDLVTNLEWGRLTMSYLFAILAHNWTEAGFKALSINYFIFFLIAIDFPRVRQLAATATGVVDRLSVEPEVVHA